MRIVIAEDSAVLQAGLERLLSDAGHEILATVEDGTSLLKAANTLSPDFALVDVRMPPTFTDEGVRAASIIRSQNPTVRILIFSQYVEERYASELLADNRGGFGYLLKDRVANVAEFLDAVERVGAGHTVLDPEVVAQLMVRSRQRQAMERISPREREVLTLMAQGRSNAAIGNELCISGGVVEKHISAVFSKLGLHPAEEENRRVMAVLRFLDNALGQTPAGKGE